MIEIQECWLKLPNREKCRCPAQGHSGIVPIGFEAKPQR